MERVMELGAGRSYVALAWRLDGEDLSVAVTGGERPHIGAAALAWQENGRTVVRSLSVPGHREAELACSCAEILCRTAGRTTLVRCGIHIDRAERQEIALLCEHARLLAENLAGLLAQG